MPDTQLRDTPSDHLTVRGIVSSPASYDEAVAILPRPGLQLSSTGSGTIDLEVVAVSRPWRESPDQDWQFEATYRRLRKE